LYKIYSGNAKQNSVPQAAVRTVSRILTIGSVGYTGQGPNKARQSTKEVDYHCFDRLTTSMARTINMLKVYEEIIDFIAAGVSPGDVSTFTPSAECRDRVADLISMAAALARALAAQAAAVVQTTAFRRRAL
jgi:hypothetical protein